MPNEEITKTLESIGMNKNEILIYLDLIRMGKSSAGDVSKRTNIHRSNVYDIIEKLIKKAIVKEVIEENRKVFTPLPPSELLNNFKQIEIDLQTIIPEIEKIQNNIPKDKSRVMMLEGIQSIRSTINGFLNSEETICTYGIPKDVVEILGGFIHDFHERRLKKKILMKHIYNKDAYQRMNQLNQMEYTKARFLPSLYDTKINTTICGDQVTFFLWEPPFTTIIIQNKALAEAYQNYFEILWEEAKISYS